MLLNWLPDLVRVILHNLGDQLFTEAVIKNLNKFVLLYGKTDHLLVGLVDEL